MPAAAARSTKARHGSASASCGHWREGLDLPIDGAAVLFAHDHISRQQFDILGTITRWLQLASRAWGQRGASCADLWAALLSAMSSTAVAAIPVPAGADAARSRLMRVLQRLDGSRQLVVDLSEGRIPPLCIRVIEKRLVEEDSAAIERLRDGLDKLAGRSARH